MMREKYESGKSSSAVGMALKSHTEKDENGKSKRAVELGKKGSRVTSRQVWMSTVDGFIGNSGNVARHNKARGWDPNARVKLE
jgi:hypothetical protein